jgi:hypothetical protein
MLNSTIIYYSSSKEGFEGKIRENILKVKGNVPLISVTQKPIDFGENICVGDVGQTYLNAFRQLLIGCEKATTEFIFTAEADCLYPEGYFDFNPTDPNAIYSYDNTWILYKGHFYKKDQTHGSLVYGREWLINFLKECLKDCPKWSREKVYFPFYKPDQVFQSFTGKPVINIRTGNGTNKKIMPTKDPVDSLDYWGEAKELIKYYAI